MVAGLDVDVLAMQEVDRDQPRSGGADLARVAADAMAAEHVVFAPTLFGTPGGEWVDAAAGERPGPAYGCALVSRVPLRDVTTIRIPAAPIALPLWVPGSGVVVVREEPRVAITARVTIDGADLTVVATHLPFVPGWKHWQLARLTRQLAGSPDPLVLLGDLNVGRAAERITGYRDLADLPTFPAASPRLRLDHVMLRGDLAGAARAATPEQSVSDHSPLVVGFS